MSSDRAKRAGGSWQGFWAGRQRRGGIRARLTGLLVLSAGAFLSQSAPASRGAEKHPARQAVGLVMEVEPGRLTLQGTDGRQIILTTFEDYTDQVPVGAKVTAWYYPQDGGENVLKSLDYPAEGFFVPAETIRQDYRKIIVLPGSSPPDTDDLYEGIREYLHSSLGWYVAPAFLAAEIRKQTERTSSTLDAIDPATGGFDFGRYLGQAEALIPRVASQARVDAVLQVDVKQVQATVVRFVASWDGAEESLAGPGTRALARFSLFSKKDEVPAATVVLKLWDAKGRLLWRNRRGLALLEVLAGKGNRLEERPLSEYLGNPQNLQDWLDAAFKSLASGGEPGQVKGAAGRVPSR